MLERIVSIGIIAVFAFASAAPAVGSDRTRRFSEHDEYDQ